MIEKFLKLLLAIIFGFYFRFLDKQKHSPNLVTVGKLYSNGGFPSLFAKIRMWDASLEMIEKLVPRKGIILDLGCGDGLLGNYLALSSVHRKIIGIERNLERLREAKKGIKNTVFKQGDVMKVNFPPANVILLVHVLHHLSSLEDQEKLLKKCREKLQPNGRLMIVEISENPLIKYLLTWLIDAIVFPILFEHQVLSRNFFYRRKKHWQFLLKDLGFRMQTISAHQGKPFSHVIFICQRHNPN